MPRRYAEFIPVPGLAERIQQARKNSGYSLRGIAKELGISLSGYVNYELGKAEPRLTVLIRLSELFRMSLDDLLGTSKVLKPEINLRQQNLNELWSICERLNTREGRNSLDERNSVFKSISLLVKILSQNTIVKMPDNSRVLATFQDSLKEINAIFSGKKVNANPCYHIDSASFLPLRRIGLLNKLLEVFLEVQDVEEIQYTQEDYFKKLLEIKSKFRIIQDELEMIYFSNVNIKE